MIADRLATIRVLYRAPDTLSLWGIPYGMRPGQQPRDLQRVGNTNGWIWLGCPGWWYSIPKADQDAITQWLAARDVPAWPCEWCTVD